ncbi:MAG: two-component regulator propeller domain-containing protein [Ignavibacteriaceae bacterium]
MKIVSTFILLFFLTALSSAFTDDYIFKQLTESDGLSQSTIFAMIQDNRGFLWFGTIEGLNRYDGYEFKVYTNDPTDSTSISDNLISSIFEDSENYIWVGTVNGYLNRFDRKTETFKRYYIHDYFETFKKPGEEYYEYPLAFSRNHYNSVTSITEDADSNLWIGTWGNGLIRFDKKNEMAIHYYNLPDEPRSLSSNRIMDILADKERNIWVATFGGGLNKVMFSNDSDGIGSLFPKNKISFNTYRNEKNRNFSISDNKLISLFEDKNETIWIGTYHGGLNKLDRENKSLPQSEAKFLRYITREGTNNSLCNNTVMDIVQDLEGYLWIGTFGDGIDRLEIEPETFQHFYYDPDNLNSIPDNEILSLLVDKSGILWVGAHLGEGVTKVQKNTAKFNYLKNEPSNSQGLNDDVVWSIYKDNRNNLWVGTYRGGLNLINQRNKRLTAYQFDINDPNSISNNHIRVIEEDNINNLWIGTYNGGLNRFNPRTGRFERFLHDPENTNSLSANQVQDIFIESDRIIWVATFGGGLNKLSFETNSSDEVPKFTIYENNPSDPTTITDNRVYTLYKDTKGNFWIGTYGGGLNEFDQSSETFISFQHNPDDPNSISDNKVMTILEDSQGTLWIGTSGGGLNKFDPPTKKFTRYSTREGLTSAVVYGILEDNSNHLWISTDDGIFEFDPASERFTHFGLEDGLLSLEFSGGAYFKDKNGMMYFGGINGINYFYPDSIVINSYIPTVVISSIKIFNEELKGEQDEIILSHDQNFISFEFSSLDYSNPKQNKYSFILEGLQKEWHLADASFRMANYTNLPAGEYIFYVKGTNSDGIWNETGTRIKLIITPPYWQTWWFIMFVIITLGFLIYYISTVSIKNQLAIEQLKTKIASDLHDNVGAGLTEISILSEVATQKMDDNAEKNSKEIKSISNISRELVDNMSDIVWVVNPQRDSLYDLIIKLKDSYNEFLNTVGISFQVKNIDKTDDVHLPMDYKQNLLMMFKEAINNAIKHSNCKKITLDANVRNDVIELILTDDGIGIDDHTNKSGNGITNMENRAKKLGGRMKLRSEREEGTKVIFISKLSKLRKIWSFFKR